MLKIHLNVRSTCALSKILCHITNFWVLEVLEPLEHLSFSHVLGSQNAVWKYGTLGTFRNSHILRILWIFFGILGIFRFFGLLEIFFGILSISGSPRFSGILRLFCFFFQMNFSVFLDFSNFWVLTFLELLELLSFSHF